MRCDAMRRDAVVQCAALRLRCDCFGVAVTGADTLSPLSRVFKGLAHKGSHQTEGLQVLLRTLAGRGEAGAGVAADGSAQRAQETSRNGWRLSIPIPILTLRQSSGMQVLSTLGFSLSEAQVLTETRRMPLSSMSLCA